MRQGRDEGAGVLIGRALRRRRNALVPLTAALLLAGCGAFRGPPPETYDLSAPAPSGRTQGVTAAQILLPEPKALQALDSDRIVVRMGPKISYYPDAQWPDRLPKLFQERAIEAFERSRRARAVGRPGEGLSIDYQLLTDIRSFEYDSNGNGGIARVEISARILNDRNGRVLASRLFQGEVTVTQDNAAGVVAGLDGALSQVLTDLVNWTVGRL